MARIRRWQEALMVVLAAMFFSVGRAWPLGAGELASTGHPTYSRLVTGVSGKRALGLELGPQRPYVRLFRASLAPVAMPLAAGAYVAMAGAPAAPATNSSCTTDCDTSEHTCCSVNPDDPCCDKYCEHCYDVQCTTQFSGPGGYSCYTCGHGTCGACGE